MASGRLENLNGELNSKVRPSQSSTDDIKVYTRRARKKAPKTSSNNETATATENPTDTTSPSASQDPTPTQAEASCAADGAATSSPRPTTRDGLAASTAPHTIAEDDVGAVVRRDVDPADRSSQEKSPRQEDVESSPQHMASLSKDNLSTQNQAEDGGANELVRRSGDNPENLRGTSPLSCEKDISDDREVAAQLPVDDEPPNKGETTPVPPQVPVGSNGANGNGVVKPIIIYRVDDRIRFNLRIEAPRSEVEDLRRKLEYELHQIRRVYNRLESKEHQLASHNTQISHSNLSNSGSYFGAGGVNVDGYGHPQPQFAQNDMLVDRRELVRMNSEVAPVGGYHESRLSRVNSDIGAARNLEPRPYSRQLSVAIMENNRSANEFVEKEKRTPKANQYYRNSEFLLGKDRLPPESNKRLKTNNGRRHSGDSEHAYGFGFGFDGNRNQVFKSCTSLLQRLMKHKYGWVFNEPVNPKELGLHDYHDIIKHPMDLGTIKTRLSQHWYKTPREFAEDVRLVFRNAMTYNPKGQDVHVMAEQLLQIFEERWAILETEGNLYWKYQTYEDAGLPTPTSTKAHPRSHFGPPLAPLSSPAVPGFMPTPSVTPMPLYAPAAPQMRNLDRPQPMATSMAVEPRIHRPHVGRTPVPKKPKAKDPNKRDMTYEEKQRLSTHLQGLPVEKLDAVVQIIKKRNSAVSQHGDEIEVDIDSVDTETLWELDRFVTNYKKSLSKYKRKAELALQARPAANQNTQIPNTTSVVTEVQIGTAFEKSTVPPAVESENHGNSGAKSSSSSSSSSDSGSSSSDSDSDSSSGDGSDGEKSPKT